MWGPEERRALGALVPASKGQDTGLLTLLLGLAQTVLGRTQEGSFWA